MLKSVQDLKQMQIEMTIGFYLEIQQHFKVSNSNTLKDFLMACLKIGWIIKLLCPS